MDKPNIRILPRHLIALLSHNDYLEQFLDSAHTDITTPSFMGVATANVNLFTDEQLGMLADWMFTLDSDDYFDAYEIFIVMAYLKPDALNLKLQEPKVKAFLQQHLHEYKDCIDVLCEKTNSDEDGPNDYLPAMFNSLLENFYVTTNSDKNNNNDEDANPKPLSFAMLLALAKRGQSESVSSEDVKKLLQDNEEIILMVLDQIDKDAVEYIIEHKIDDINSISSKQYADSVKIGREFIDKVADFQCILAWLDASPEALAQMKNGSNKLLPRLLYSSALSGNFKLVEKLFNAGVELPDHLPSLSMALKNVNVNPNLNQNQISTKSLTHQTILSSLLTLGNIETLRVLLTKPHYEPETILGLAVHIYSLGRKDIFNELLPGAHEANFATKKLENSQTILHFIALTGNAAGVQLAISEGADVNAANDQKKTPFHLACECGRMEMAKTLFENGADLNATDEDGSTPLVLALTKEDGKEQFIDLACWLIENGADLTNTNTLIQGVEGEAQTKLIKAILAARKEHQNTLTGSPGSNPNANFANNNNGTTNQPAQKEKPDIRNSF